MEALLKKPRGLEPCFEAPLLLVGDLRGVGELRGRKKHVSSQRSEIAKKISPQKSSGEGGQRLASGSRKEKGFQNAHLRGQHVREELERDRQEDLHGWDDDEERERHHSQKVGHLESDSSRSRKGSGEGH